MQLLNEDISCVEELPNLIVNYTKLESNLNTNVSIDIENCTINTTNSDSTSYVCHVTDKDACWDEYDIAVAYQSVIGGEVNFSSFSEALSLQGPSEGVCVCVCVCVCVFM